MGVAAQEWTLADWVAASDKYFTLGDAAYLYRYLTANLPTSHVLALFNQAQHNTLIR
jgi:hypothetical protein